MYFWLGKHWQNRFYIKYKPGSDHTTMQRSVNSWAKKMATNYRKDPQVNMVSSCSPGGSDFGVPGLVNYWTWPFSSFSWWMFPLKMVDLSIVFCMFTRGYHDFRKLPRSKLKMIIGERQGNSKIQPFLKTRIVLLDISHHVPHHSWLCIYIYYIYIHPCILCCLRAPSFAMILPEPPSGCSCLGSYPYPPADQVPWTASSGGGSLPRITLCAAELIFSRWF